MSRPIDIDSDDVMSVMIVMLIKTDGGVVCF